MGYGFNGWCRCVVCGETVLNEAPFFTDKYGSMHLECEDIFFGGVDDEQVV